MGTTKVISIGTLNVEAGSGYVATLDMSFTQPGATVNRAQRDGDSPLATAVSPAVAVFTLAVVVDAAAAGSAEVEDARRRALMRALDTTLTGSVTVTIESAAGPARRRWMRFVVLKVDQAPNQFGWGFVASLESADDVRWCATTTEEVTWTFDESGTRVINNIGDLVAFPEVTARPTGVKTGGNWVYTRPFLVSWASPLSGPGHILDITGGGINTAALVTAGKIASAANMGVHMNGRYRPFWFGNADGQPGGFNSTTTRINVVANIPRQVVIQTDEYITEAATTWRVRSDGGLPPAGMLFVEGEYIYYQSRGPRVLYGVRRAQYGSEASEHAAGANAVVVAAVGYLLYGPNAAVPDSARTLDYLLAQQLEPLPANGSTSAEWVYNVFADGERAGRWELTTIGNDRAFFKESTPDGLYDTSRSWPWTAMGQDIGFLALSEFGVRFAIPIKEVTLSGRHWGKGSAAQYPNSAKLHALDDNEANRLLLWDSAAGVSRAANNTFSATVTLPTGDGAPLYNRLSWGYGLSNFVQADIQSLTVRFQDGYLPSVDMGAEESRYDLDLEIWNQTTDDRMRIIYPNAIPGEGLIIDANAQTARNETTGQNEYAAVTTPWEQERFLTLAPGNNTISVSEDVMGTVEVTIRYQPRWYA